MLHQQRNDKAPSHPTVNTAYQINNLSVPATHGKLARILN